MTTFIGEYTAKVDDKGRLVFPSAFKAVMPTDGDMRFVLKKTSSKTASKCTPSKNGKNKAAK